MAPRKGTRKDGSASGVHHDFEVGDLVLVKMKGWPKWPAIVSEPNRWDLLDDLRKVFVCFFGTKQIAFCPPADVESFTEAKRVSLLGKRNGKGSDFRLAVDEIINALRSLDTTGGRSEELRRSPDSSGEHSIDSPSGLDKVEKFDSVLSKNGHEKVTDVISKEIADEDLPLLKRARFRMPFAADPSDSQAAEVKKSPTSSSSVDREALLPPPKRLRRALSGSE
ncbi:hypothetical protein LIER_11579 [Lithospermum erythrorhizon]|uniref:PWWP domain-containing protein n=1 Tax=Lithospermum erythrorhizon TaxID=34254 RepID=A0AAV3PQI4_LITER